MKKKINLRLMSIAALAIITTLILVSAVFYDLFQKQIFSDLKSYCRIIVSSEQIYSELGLNLSEKEQIKQLEVYDGSVAELRITVVDADGTVQYDTDADVKSMDNHMARPEIQSAFENGEGSIVRRSDTLDRNTFYYAYCMSDGRVIRVAREADSLFSVMGSAIPTIFFVTAVLLLICMVVSHLLTQSFLKPIEQLAEKMDSNEEIKAYEELVPLIQTIKNQHEDIVRNAKIRQEFTANVSHELKTPLTSISGYSELIENRMATEEDMVRFGSEIHKNANRLLTLINDIIKLSELDSNTMEMVYEDVNLYELAETCVEMLQLNAGKHGIILSMDKNNEDKSSVENSYFVKADKQMIEEVLYNLCDNAIRYNNEGGYVNVNVSLHNDEVVLCVKDSGIGISKEHQERIFERFYRVDKSRSKSTGGTGLGLAIVKHIVAQHEADMELESDLGKGTKITIRFPKPDII